MGNLRDRVTSSFYTGNLAWSETRVTPVEVIASMAKCERLASLLYRARTSDRSAYKAASLLLLRYVHDIAGKKRWCVSMKKHKATNKMSAPVCH